MQLLQASCSIQPVRTDMPQSSSLWATHQAQMRAITQWHVKGKLGYKNPSDAGSAWLDWRQQSERFELLLGGPFGAGTVHIFGDDHLVTLRQVDKPDLTATSTKALSREILGWELPIGELPYWIRGIPAPDAPVANQSFNSQGLLSTFQQTGWQLTLSKYRDTKMGELPSKLVATQNGARFTLIIKAHDFDFTELN
jgi:outer membrane lipoprotein LolB